MWLGIFVGGRARRMGGVPKGLLRAPDTGETLIDRLARVGREAGLEPILIGAADFDCTVPRLSDLEPPVGPLSGLAALLAHAAGAPAFAVACDMPRVSRALLSRLARETPDAEVLAPRDLATGKWEPLCARYDSARVVPVLTRALARGERSFQALFRHLSVVELPLDEAERAELHDWDTPEDMR